MPEDKNKSKTKSWKAKAVERNKIIHKQNKRIQELTESRNNLRKKYKSLRLEVGYNPITLGGKKAKHHSYSTMLVWFCVQAQVYGRMSLRGCVQVLLCLELVSGRLDGKGVPSYSSIRNWACKAGYYRLHHQKHESKGKWLYIMDESISISKEKILLVLGVPLNALNFKESLTISDVRVLSVEVASTWKGEDIINTLKRLDKECPLGYVVSDQGNNLQKSYRLGDYIHIPDCTHYLAKIIENLYKEESVFVDFSKTAANLRRKWSLSKYAAYMPPVQRSKARFANLFPVIQWAHDCLKLLKTFPEEVQVALEFLSENKDWIGHFYVIQEHISFINKLLKNKGFSQQNYQTIKDRLAKTNGEKEKLFAEKTLTYLSTLSEINIENEEKFYCCSDIIESAFGKFKQKINPKSTHSISEFALTLASFGSVYNQEEIKQALETVKEDDVKKWRDKSPSLAQQRRKIFGKNGGKK